MENISDGDAGNCAARAPYALQATDDSMAPEFKNGAIIIVDPDYPHTHGAYIVIDYDNETWFRQFKLIEGEPYLVALNNDYPKTQMVKEFKIRGVVTQQAKHRKNGVKNAVHYI